MADLAAQAAAKKANSGVTTAAAAIPAAKPVGMPKPLGGVQQSPWPSNKPAAGATGMNINWAHSYVKPAPQKFNVDATAVHTKFETSQAGASIRETMQKLSDAAKAKAYKEPAQGQGGNNNPFGQARPLRSDTFNTLKNLNNRGHGGGNFGSNRPAVDNFPPPSGGYPSSSSAPSEDRRHSQHVQKMEHKRVEFQAKITGAEPFVRKDRVQPNTFPNKHRKDDNIVVDRDVVASMVARNRSTTTSRDDLGPSSVYNRDTGNVEINVSALKAEMLRKKEYADAEKVYIETAKKARATVVLEVVLPSEGLTIRDLASKLSMRTKDLTRKLEDMGVFSATEKKADAEQGDDIVVKGDDRLVDADSAELLVLDLGFNVKRLEDKSAVRAATISERPSHVIDENVVMVPRAPVVSLR